VDLSPTAAHVIAPSSLTSLADICTAPREKGIYAWWFRPGVLQVPTAAYVEVAGRQLLYVGIAPRKPSAAGKESASRLRNRLMTHATKDASRSTLRLSLGVLLSRELSLSLGTHGSRVHWGPEGESRLSRWMEQHASVTWLANDQPWVAERELIRHVPLALNLDERDDPFATFLSARRRELRSAARHLA